MSPTITPHAGRGPVPAMAAPAMPAAIQISFEATAAAPSGGRVIREYLDPRAAVAVRRPIDNPLAAASHRWPEPTDGITVLATPTARPSSAVIEDDWLTAPDHPDAPPAIDLPVDGGRLQWRPGRAHLLGPIESPDDVLAGVGDFTFYEAELRRLEAALPRFEAAAVADVPRTYRIKDAEAGQWDRLGATMEQLAMLRLTFARLEPRLSRPSPSLPAAGRRAFKRLCARTEVADRAAAVSDRLEACEDLYEGAVDRITDHRWWRRGHRLETIIVVLLALEGVQLAIELLLRLVGR